MPSWTSPGAWTYDPSQLATSPKDAVRFLIQDTDSTRPLLVDDEIGFAISSMANQYMAAAMCCDVLVAKKGSVKSRKIGDLSIDYDPEFYRGLAAMLRARGMTYQAPYCGGISIADRQALEADPDWVRPRLFNGQFDNPGASQPAGVSAADALTNPNAL